MSRTHPNGRVLGVDIIPAQPPKGVSTIQGNFLSPEIQAYIQDFLRSPDRGRPRQPSAFEEHGGVLELGLDSAHSSTTESGQILERTVDVVLSDMSAPWYQTSGFWKRSLSDPYNRMMNASGVSFRDHAGSMVCCLLYIACAIPLLTFVQDLCHAALRFSSNILKTGGHFVCKFYQGAEDKELEKQLREVFQKVHRLKPESSRSVCHQLLHGGPQRPSTKARSRNPRRPILLGWSENHEASPTQVALWMLRHSPIEHQRSPPSNSESSHHQTRITGSLENLDLFIFRGFVPLNVGQRCLRFLVNLVVC